MGETGVVQQYDDDIGGAGGRQNGLRPPRGGLAGGAPDDRAVNGGMVHAFSVAQAPSPTPTGDIIQAT